MIEFLLALSHRARCYLAKQQYHAAKKDLDYVLSIDSENGEAQVKFFFKNKYRRNFRFFRIY